MILYGIFADLLLCGFAVFPLGSWRLLSLGLRMSAMHDPVLNHTSWTPIARGGHAWHTHHLFTNKAKSCAELRSNTLSGNCGLFLLACWRTLCETCIVSQSFVGCSKHRNGFPLLKGPKGPGLIAVASRLAAAADEARTLQPFLIPLQKDFI